MSDAWAYVVGFVVLLIAIAWLNSTWENHRRKKLRKKTVPIVEDNLSVNRTYNVQLSDGRRFESVQIIGTSDHQSGHYSFSGWEDMIILRKPDQTRVFLKQSAIRFVEEL